MLKYQPKKSKNSFSKKGPKNIFFLQRNNTESESDDDDEAPSNAESTKMKKITRDNNHIYFHAEVNRDNIFELIAGERRWQAAQLAGLHEVPAVVIEADNLKSLELAIIENVQRKDLNPIEVAESYKNLIDNFKYDQEKVTAYIKSRMRGTYLVDDIVQIMVNLNSGEFQGKAWGCDLSKKYIEINSEYTT